MKLLGMADLHGHLPDYRAVGAAEVICIAGDIVPMWASNAALDGENLYRQARWLYTRFYPWVDSLECDRVVMTWGNHDWIGMEPDLIPKYDGDKLVVLVDDPYVYEGVHFWGTPWQPIYNHWAFNLPEWELENRWDRIPDDTDILIVHGPPKGFGDRVGRQQVGSPSLTAKIRKVNPRWVVCGHVHNARGRYKLTPGHRGNLKSPTTVLNCSVVDTSYKLMFKGMEFEL